jgi:hypothetical protein
MVSLQMVVVKTPVRAAGRPLRQRLPAEQKTTILNHRQPLARP